MRVRNIPQIKQVGYALSDKFKTVGTYGLQPIIFSKLSYRIAMIYINHIRPLIAPDKASWEPNDYLWLDYNGNPETHIGRLITKYFRKKIKVNVTTTCFRSLYETESESLFDSGVISASQRASIRQIGGHTSGTVRQHYLKHNMNQNVDNARSVMNSLSPADSSNSFPGCDDNLNSESIDFFPSVSNLTTNVMSKAPWGTLHSCYKSDRHRIPWDVAEVEYLGKLALSLMREDSEKYGKTLMSHCLKKIKNDLVAIPIFHENHILTTGNYYYS